MYPPIGRAFRYNFTDILETFFPIPGDDALHYQDHLMPRLEVGEYDALILTSCKYPFPLLPSISR